MSTNVLRVPIFSLACTALSSCATFDGRPMAYQERAAVLEADKPYLSADVRNNSEANIEAYRNNVIYARLEVIDLNYYDFESKLLSAGSGINLGADLTTLALNGLGATTGSSGAKAAFAAASAGVVGARGAINTDIFYQKTLPAMIAQMRADRQKVLLTTTAGLLKPTSQYSLRQALIDVNSYYVAGTLPGALLSVTSNAGHDLTVANAQLAQIRSATWVEPTKGSSAARLLAWLYPGGDATKPINMVNRAALIAWMQAFKGDLILASIPFENMLSGSGLSNAEADRQQAIKDLKVPEVGQ